MKGESCLICLGLLITSKILKYPKNTTDNVQFVLFLFQIIIF